MEIYFNEASIDHACNDQLSSQNAVLEFVTVFKSINEPGFQKQLRVTKDLLSREFTLGYSLFSWFGDNTVGRDEKIYLKTILAKSPFIDDEIASVENNQKSIIEFYVGGCRVLGLGLGYIKDLPVVSVNSKTEYSVDPCRLLMQKYDGDVVSEDNVYSLCLSTVSQVESRRQWFRERVVRDLPNGLAFLEKCSEVFEYLIFCDQAVGQIRSLCGSELFYDQIIKHMYAINKSMAHWKPGEPFSLDGITYSSESRQTLDHPRYGKYRSIICPDMKERIFSFHTKPTGGNIRIHFFPDAELKKAYIGYVGSHLPTVNYPT